MNRIGAGSIFERGCHGKGSSHGKPRVVTLALLVALGLLGLAAHSALAQDLPGQWQTLAPSGPIRQEVSYVEAGGKFYLAGGGTAHERYNPQTGSWSTVKPLPADLDHIQGVKLGGKIYYIGGLSAWPKPHASTVHIYDPKTDSFDKGAPMPAGRGRGAGGAAAYNGKIYYAGGLHDGKAVPWFDVYDPKTNSWTQLKNMPRARDHFQAAVIGGKFYAIGGRDSGVSINATITKVDVYDLTKGAGGTWQTPNTELPTPRGGFATGVLGKEILVIGGEGGGKAYNTVEAYNTANNSWRKLEPMPTARHGIQAAVCNGGIYVAAGGTKQGGGRPTDKHEVFFLGAPTTCGTITAPPATDTARPTISGLKPKPDSKVRDRTPRIGATVRDGKSELTRADIRLYVDGRAKRFSYHQETDRLWRTTGRLSLGKHTVKIVATDEAGNTATKRWSFKVVK